MQDILPDSRAKTTRGAVMRGSVAWVPVFCANCGKDGGLCHELSTHMFYLCNGCFKTYGEIAGTMAVPDSVAIANMVAEQEEAYGRQLSHNELLQVVADDNTPLATLLKEFK